MGDLGGNVARRMQAFGARVTGVQRTKKAGLPAGFAEAYTMESLDELLPKADIVVNWPAVHARDNRPYDKAAAACDEAGCSLCERRARNFVRNKDLVFALESGHLGGAILDVIEEEPLPEASPLWDMENVLLTPHIAGPSFDSSPDVQTAIWEICMENLDNFLTGKPVTHVVSRRAGY